MNCNVTGPHSFKFEVLLSSIEKYQLKCELWKYLYHLQYKAPLLMRVFTLFADPVLHTSTSSSSSLYQASNEEIPCSLFLGRSNSFPAKFAIRFYPTFLQDLSKILWQHTSRISPALHQDFSTLLCISVLMPEHGTLLLQNIYIPLFKIKMLAKQVLQGIVNFHTVKRLIVFYMKVQISINVFHAVWG